MTLPDTAPLLETNSLPPELSIVAPRLEALQPISSAAQLTLDETEHTFNQLASNLNAETELEMGLASHGLTYPIGQQTREELLDIVYRRVRADQESLKNLLQTFVFFSQDPIPNSTDEIHKVLDLHSGMDHLVIHNSLHPQSPTSSTLHRLEWYVEGLVHQWLYSNKPASQMDRELEQRYKDMAKSLFQGTQEQQGEAAERYTNQQYIREMLKNTFNFLQQSTRYGYEPILTAKPRILVIGSGNGKVEKDILAQFNLPAEMIDAIDILPENMIGGKPEGMTFYGETNLLQWSQNQSNHNKYDLILCIGSTLVNHEDYLKHLEYAHASQKLLKDNGVYCYETRALEPDRNNNAANIRARQFASKHPLRPPGTASSAHPLEHTQPGDFGASMQPWQLQRLIFDLVGLESLNYPLRSPELENRYFENLNNNEFILSQLRRDPTTHNAIQEPAWQAGEGNYRISHILRKLPESNTALATIVERLFSRALEKPHSAQLPSPAATTTASF